MSGSKTASTQNIFPNQNNPHVPYNLLPQVGAIPNMMQNLSPHYNFQALFQSRAELWAAWSQLKTRGDEFLMAMDNLTLPNLIASINTQQLSSVWQDDLNAIRSRADAIRNDVETIRSCVSRTTSISYPGGSINVPDPTGVADALQVRLLRDSAAAVREIGNTIDDLRRALDELALTATNGLLTRVRTAFDALQNLIAAIGNEIAALVNRVSQFLLHLDDFIAFILKTVQMAKNHSSLMDTPGLKRAIHEALRQATPQTTAANANASDMDKAIFNHWKARRTAKVSDPLVRAPELILTASNITAGRATLLCLCDVETKQQLGAMHTWVVELDQSNVGYQSAKGVEKQVPPVNDPSRWIFGSWPTDYIEQFRDDDRLTDGLTVGATDGEPPPDGESAETPFKHFTFVEMKMAGRAGAPLLDGRGPMPVTPETTAPPLAQMRPASDVAAEVRGRPLAPSRSALNLGGPSQTQASDVSQFMPGVVNVTGGTIAASPASVNKKEDSLKDLLGSPFMEPELWNSNIKGTSLLAAAALTSAAIPIAFPPKYWRFNNPYGEAYHHWMIDGGLCDNRPIQQAINAGADCIVSFELTPLSTAIEDIPLDVPRPGIDMVGGGLTDLQINSAFYRFIETYVGQESAANPPTEARMWRISPAQKASSGKNIGVYDFNGYWEGGKLQMGLFDWYMRGYLDAHAGELTDVWNDPADNACAAYKAVAVNV